MLRILFWLLTVPLLALAGAFAASNTGPVVLRLWPLPLEWQVPVFVAVLGAFLLGIALTAFAFWLASVPGRLTRRRLARHERVLKEETERLRHELEVKNQPPLTAVPGPADDTQARRLLAAGDR